MTRRERLIMSRWLVFHLTKHLDREEKYVKGRLTLRLIVALRQQVMLREFRYMLFTDLDLRIQQVHDYI